MVDPVAQGAATAQPTGRDPVGQAEALDLEAGGVGVALDGERVERLAEPAAVLAGGLAAGGGRVRDRPGHRHRLRERRRAGAEPGHQRPQVRPVARRGAGGVGMRASGRGGRSGAGGPSRGARSRRDSSTGRSPAGASAAQQREVLADPDARASWWRSCRSSPRISAGASGLGSQVSSWLGPPHRKIRMHDFARPNPSGLAAAARLRYSSGNPNPAIARAPARIADRREIPRPRRNSRQPRRRSISGPPIAASPVFNH